MNRASPLTIIPPPGNELEDAHVIYRPGFAFENHPPKGIEEFEDHVPDEETSK